MVFESILIEYFEKNGYKLFKKGNFEDNKWDFNKFSRIHPFFGSSRFKRLKEFNIDKGEFNVLVKLFQYVIFYKN